MRVFRANVIHHKLKQLEQAPLLATLKSLDDLKKTLGIATIPPAVDQEKPSATGTYLPTIYPHDVGDSPNSL